MDFSSQPKLHKNASEGFSISRVAIVLVILGLLAGSVLVGQNLIRSAKLRTIAAEHDKYLSAMEAFKARYYALPGDMHNATSIWGQSENCPGTAGQGNTDSKTCNGDGDGKIDLPLTSNEYFRFWQHLGNAGLIDGSYNGVTGPAHETWNAVIGTNVPGSRIDGGGWMVEWWGEHPGSATLFAMDYGHMLLFGAQTTTETVGGILTPEEQWNLDVKMDDGKPALGSLIAYPRATCADSTGPSDYEASYRLSQKEKVCSAWFRQAF